MFGSMPRPLLPARTNQYGNPICGAKLRNKDAFCKNAPGHMTDHLGQGRCFLHGGITTGTLAHGRYSNIQRTQLARLYAEHERDPDPLNVLAELAAARALFEDYVNRYNKYTAALLAWHQSYVQQPIDEDRLLAVSRVLLEFEILLKEADRELTPELADQLALATDTIRRLQAAQREKPRRVLDVSTAYQMLDTISKIVDRVNKDRAQNAISRADMLRVMTEFGRAVETFVKDPVALQRIKEAWLSVHL